MSLIVVTPNSVDVLDIDLNLQKQFSVTAVDVVCRHGSDKFFLLTDDDCVLVVSVEDHEIIKTIPVEAGDLITASRDGRLIATAASDVNVNVYDTESSNLLYRTRVSSIGNSLAFVGSNLVVSVRDRMNTHVRFYSSPITYEETAHHTLDFRVSNSEELMALRKENRVCIMNVATKIYRDVSVKANDVCFSEDDTHLAIATNTSIVLRRTRDLTFMGIIKLETTNLNSVVCVQGLFVATNGYETRVLSEDGRSSQENNSIVKRMVAISCGSVLL
jgi:WD40 repeat protein